MADSSWLRQTKDKPLFPDLLWSRPENKKQAGKLLIIGGTSHGFAAIAKAYQEASNAGIGTLRIVLPDSLRSQMAHTGINAEFAPSTQSGGFSTSALADLLEQAAWADGVLFAGDLGRNSETAILLEKFLNKFDGQVTLTQDAADYATNMPQIIKLRANTLLVLTMAQLQKLMKQSNQTSPVSLDMDLVRLVDIAANFSQSWGIDLLIRQHSYVLVAHGQRVSTTNTPLGNEDFWRVEAATHAAVWWLQNPENTFESLTTSVLQIV